MNSKMADMFKHIGPFMRFYKDAETIFQVHSPYLFEIVDKTIENPDLNSDKLKFLLDLKKQFEKDGRIFENIDFGALSKKSNYSQRTLADFSKNSSSGRRILTMMFHLSSLVKPKNFIELGAGLGFTSAAVGLGNPDTVVHTIEGNPSLAEFTKEVLAISNIQHHLYNNEISQVLNSLDTEIKWDMVFNDGNHTYEAAMEYFDFFRDRLSDSAIFIMDDIRWSDGMWKAWQEIKNHPSVRGSMDLYTLGIVFTNPDIKEKLEHKIVPTMFKPWKSIYL